MLCDCNAECVFVQRLMLRVVVQRLMRRVVVQGSKS